RRTGLALSFLLHGLAMAVLLVAARRPSRHLPDLPVYVVHLTTIPEIMNLALPEPAKLAELPAPVRTVPSRPKSLPGPQPPSFSAEDYRQKLLRKLSRYQPLTREVETGEPVRETFSAEAYRQSLEAKLATAKPEISPRPQAQPALPEIPKLAARDVPAVSLPRLSSSQEEIPDWYVNLLKKKIEENWRLLRPYSLKEETALVSFRIEKDGNVSQPVVERPSRLLEFNRSVVAAVKNSAPFPPLPREIKTGYLDVTVEFSARGIR
ncbi:MAG TPA: TonB family protein, partial [bacterium]|nr:TonB family protein [bacterium]